MYYVLYYIYYIILYIIDNIYIIYIYKLIKEEKLNASLIFG